METKWAFIMQILPFFQIPIMPKMYGYQVNQTNNHET
jgi:hypothetical protein